MKLENIATTQNSVTSNKRKSRGVMFSLLAAAVLAAGGGYWEYWTQVGSRYVSTDDAYTAAEVAQVTAEIAGPVAEVRVVDTQRVKQGDILVVIDSTDAKLVMAQAQAELASAKAQVASATTEVGRTRIDLQRREALVKSGSVSGDELTRVKSGASTAIAALESSNAAVALAKSHVEKAKVDLERTVIRSPVDGVIVNRQVQLGQRVQPSVPLLSVVPVQDTYVNANFKEVQLNEVRAGQTAEMVSDLYGDKVVYHGVVDGFSGGTGAAFSLIPAQNATGNWIKVVQRLPVRIRLDQTELQNHPLRVGLSMKTSIDLRSKS